VQPHTCEKDSARMGHAAVNWLNIRITLKMPIYICWLTSNLNVPVCLATENPLFTDLGALHRGLFASISLRDELEVAVLPQRS